MALNSPPAPPPPPIKINPKAVNGSASAPATKGTPPPPPPPNLSSSRPLTPLPLSNKPKAKGTLHWQEIPAIKLPQNSFWLQDLPSLFENSLKIDKEQFESLFCEGSTGSLKKSKELTPISAGTRPKESLCVQLLGLKRANNCAIGLSKFSKHFTESSLLDAVVACSPSLSIDDLQSLKSLIPTSEERVRFMFSQKSMKDDASILSASSSSAIQLEDFMITMSSEPNLSWMLDTLK